MVGIYPAAFSIIIIPQRTWPAVRSDGAVYLIGRARSEEELKKALEAARETEDVKKVVNYVEVRP